ncbi:MAG: sigma-54-dependent Fis family transcriptional regulator [Alphaproteobacteria bacterium]|nr:sigma-54-dependent Fis family transcriptional regulator [Alphaproteobacteria bacterium]
MTRAAQVLIVEDTPSMARLYAEYLKKSPWEVSLADSAAAARAALTRSLPDAIVLDLNLPDGNGIDLLKMVKEQGFPTEVIVITAHGSLNVAVDAMKAGAFDFIVKPFNADRLLVTVRNALERRRLAETVESLGEEFGSGRYYGFIGSSLPMQAVFRIIESAAESKATVFITGESGTGKELCAEAIHKRSKRRNGPFVALNCAAIPKDLLESELFGHTKGAFTGATSDREGATLQANGGTLFLDEIGEMDPSLQSKMLRFLQTSTVQRVGSAKVEPVDVRIVCATNRDPMAEVKAGRFREDLFYRLHVIPIHLPPLRDREDDSILIARAFLDAFAKEEGKSFARFSPEVEGVLRAYDWPGNVRQLQNVVRNIVVLHQGDMVTPDMLPPPLNGLVGQLAPAPAAVPVPAMPVAGIAPQMASMPEYPTASVFPAAAAPVSAAAPMPAGEGDIKPLWLVEKEAIDIAIQLCGGNIPRAAQLLEISPSTIYRKRQAWEAQGLTGPAVTAGRGAGGAHG